MADCRAVRVPSRAYAFKLDPRVFLELFHGVGGGAAVRWATYHSSCSLCVCTVAYRHAFRYLLGAARDSRYRHVREVIVIRRQNLDKTQGFKVGRHFSVSSPRSELLPEDLSTLLRNSCADIFIEASCEVQYIFPIVWSANQICRPFPDPSTFL